MNHTDARLMATNQNFYDALWREAKLIRPERFSTWPLVSRLTALGGNRLEVAPGLRPRLPLAGTQFVDISTPALARLADQGGRVAAGRVTAIPFADAAFHLVCAFDIIEHVADEAAAFRELARVAAPGATLLISVPLHPEHWTPFDDLVGHCRRYQPERLLECLAREGFTLEQSAVFGMQPKSSLLVGIGMWFLTHRRRNAMRMYNRVFMPLGLRFQRTLTLVPGMVETTGVDTVLFVCRRS